MSIWRPRIDPKAKPVYAAIADAIQKAVEDGTLAEGARLPTHRALAEQLSVTAVTVTRAYGEAARRGLIDSTVGRGTFVRVSGHVPRAETRVVDLTRNLICGNEELALPREFQPQLREILRDPDYPLPAGGTPRLRAAASSWISRFGPTVPLDQVLVTPGAQPALLILLAALLRPGERVMTEEMTYPGFRSVLSLLGMAADAVAVDEHGLSPASFDAACRAGGSRVLYCVPNFQNPTGVTMPLSRRREIASIARRHDVLVIEDDVYGFLARSALPSIASLLPEQTFYLASVSKGVSPSLRLGFVTAPTRLVSRIESALAAAFAFTSTAAGEIFALLMDSGETDRIIERKRALIERHQAIAKRAFASLPGACTAGGPHAWLPLPAAIDADMVVAQALARGVAVAPGSAFVFDRSRTPNAVRVSLGAVANASILEHALLTVAGIASGSHVRGVSVI